MLTKKKSLGLDDELDFDSDPEKGRHIIDAEPSVTIAIEKFQLEELEEPKEGERIFHSHVWVNGTPLHFIVNSSRKKNLIST